MDADEFTYVNRALPATDGMSSDDDKGTEVSSTQGTFVAEDETQAALKTSTRPKPSKHSKAPPVRGSSRHCTQTSFVAEDETQYERNVLKRRADLGGHRRAREEGRMGPKKSRKVDIDELLDNLDYTDLESIEMGRRGNRPNNHFGDVEIKAGVTHYRSNIQTAVKGLREITFSEAHISLLKKTPFWYFFNALIKFDYDKLIQRCRKNEEVIRQILLRFDTNRGGFVIGGRVIELTKLDVNLIFGVYGGSNEVKLKEYEYQASPWVKRCFPDEVEAIRKQKGALYKLNFMEKITSLVGKTDETSVMDVARLTICYLLAAVLTPNQSGAITCHLMGYLQNWELVRTFDWARLIAEFLLDQLRKTKNLKVGGAAIMLEYILCEHIELVDPLFEDAFPRFLKWDITKLEKVLKRLPLPDVPASMVDGVVFEPKAAELLKFEGLRRHWENSDPNETVDSVGGDKDDIGEKDHHDADVPNSSQAHPAACCNSSDGDPHNGSPNDVAEVGSGQCGVGANDSLSPCITTRAPFKPNTSSAGIDELDRVPDSQSVDNDP